ncbi:MAG TPA: DUF2157 domain-containing protein [Flavobacteriia bacterium]|nr:DUF2157 domain-containing protein [Flavobacteriia bacterium]
MLNRKDIQIISENSNLSKNQIDYLLKENVYQQQKDWFLFLKYFTLSIGISFLSIGILFFFAYNWQDLHRFFKLGILEFLIIITTLLAIKFSETKILLSNILLTSATLLVGVLFAVFGQIYQTGANAFDFFLGWTIAVFIWVIATKFEPLWLLYISLLNITYFMYIEQIAKHWSDDNIAFILLVLNIPVLLFFTFFKSKLEIKKWLIQILAIYLVLIGTITILQGIFKIVTTYYWFNLFIVSAFYIWLIWHAVKEKSIFYIALISVSLISIFNALIFKITTNSIKFLYIGFFTIIATTLLVKFISELKNRWKDA